MLATNLKRNHFLRLGAGTVQLIKFVPVGFETAIDFIGKVLVDPVLPFSEESVYLAQPSAQPWGISNSQVFHTSRKCQCRSREGLLSSSQC